MNFTSLGIPKALKRPAQALGCTTVYPVQEKTIPAILQKRDLLGIAETGSGKTLGYVLPILTNLQDSHVRKNRYARVLVLVPTRELAVQVHEVFRHFAKALPERTHCAAVFGGVSINPQMMGLRDVDVLIATPGRLLQLVGSKAVRLSEVETLVLDEADQLLNAGFEKELDLILAMLPEKRQNLLFSATLTDDIRSLNRLLLQEPVLLQYDSSAERELPLIRQRAYLIQEERKGPLLRYLIRKEDPSQLLIFTSSAARAERVRAKLRKNGIPAESLHRKKSQGARTRILKDFKQGRLKVLVATDLLSRGIDIEALPCVINYELPRSPKLYLHRIGRTGRAERSGDAVSLITPEEEHHFQVIEKKLHFHAEKLDGSSLDLSSC